MRERDFIFVPFYLADIIGKHQLDIKVLNTILSNPNLNNAAFLSTLNENIKGYENFYINMAFYTLIICKELSLPFNKSCVYYKPQFNLSYYENIYNNIELSLYSKPEENNTVNLGQLYDNIVTLSDIYIVYVRDGFLYMMSHNKEEAKKFFLECLRLLYIEKNFNSLFHLLLNKIFL
jgi:hypothetical protein